MIKIKNFIIENQKYSTALIRVGLALVLLLMKSSTLSDPSPIIVELNSQFHLVLRGWGLI